MFASMILLAQLSTAPVGYDQAKQLADANEARLAPALQSKLLAAQSKTLSMAMKVCARQDPDLSRFTVVLSLHADGSTAKSWLRGDTALAKCMHGALATAGLPGHWPAPFYTSFEISFEGH